MILDTFVSLIYNAALLLSLTIVYDIIATRETRINRITQIYTGMIVGVIALAIMINPWIMQPGVVFDTRTILYSLAALFFGPVTAIVSGLFGIAYRIWMGGAGVYTGVLTIISAIIWGLLWRYLHRFRARPYSFSEFYQLGVLNHISMILLMFLMPKEIQWKVIQTISLPVIVIYPLATVVLGQIIVRRLQRMQEKRDLERSERKYRLLAETTKDMILLHDTRGKILYANQMALSFFGLISLEEREVNLRQFVLPEFMPMMDRFAQEHREGFMGFRIYQLKALDHKGRRRILEISSIPLEIDDQDFGILAAARDITDRMYTEEQKDSYANRLEILRELDSVVLETLSFSKTCKAVVQKLQALIPFKVLMVNEIRDDHIKIVAMHKPELKHRYLNTKDNFPYSKDFMKELWHKRNIVISDTTELTVEKGMPVRAALVKEGMRSFMYNAMIVQNELVGFLWFCSDKKQAFGLEHIEIGQEFANQLAIVLHQLGLINKIKEHAEDMEIQVEKRTEELKQANLELESFSYVVAHDLRAPLKIIAGYSEVLQTDFGDQLRQEAKEILNTIRSTTLHMDSLIRELFKLFRLNREEVHKEKINMKDIIQKHLKNVPDSFQVSVNSMLDCEGDPTLIEQVWQNLLENAVKYTLPSAQHRIHIGCKLDGDEVIYSVQDSGVGFDPKHADQIFAPFLRLHSKADFEGSGIGLALVKKIIRHHNGMIWAESEPGKGSTFYFSLPYDHQTVTKSDDQ